MLNLIKEHNNKQKLNFFFKEKIDLKQSKLDFEKLSDEEKIFWFKNAKSANDFRREGKINEFVTITQFN